MEDIVIIGGGPVGIYASTLASLHGLKGVLIEGLNVLGGQLTALYPEKEIIDIPGFDSIPAKEFINLLIKQNISKENHLPHHLNEKFITYKKENDFYLVQTSNNTYQTKTILFTSGMGEFNPRKLDLPNISQYQNIIYSIKNKNEFLNKEMVILGGGDSALDWANTLSKICKKVTLIHRRDSFRGKEEAVNLMITNGVNILKPYIVKEVVGSNNQAKELIISNESEEKRIKFDYLFVNYGLITTPLNINLKSFQNSFIVNSFCMTSEENVFAIGNACTYEGKVKNITSGLGEAVTAITKIDQIIHPNKNIPIHF